jgi:hypothetical protein
MAISIVCKEGGFLRERQNMSVDTIYDPTSEIITGDARLPERGNGGGIDDFDDRVPN